MTYMTETKKNKQKTRGSPRENRGLVRRGAVRGRCSTRSAVSPRSAQVLQLNAPRGSDWPATHPLFVTGYKKWQREGRCFESLSCLNRSVRVNSKSLLFKKQLFTDSSCLLGGSDAVAFCSGVCENFIVVPSLETRREAEKSFMLLNWVYSQSLGVGKGLGKEVVERRDIT